MMRGRMVHFARRPHRPAALRPRRQRSDLVGPPRRAQHHPARHRRTGRRAHPFPPAAGTRRFRRRAPRRSSMRAMAPNTTSCSRRWSAPTAPAPPCARADGAPARSWANAPSSSTTPTRNWRSRPPPTAASGSSPTRCTSGRAAATCASRCPTTSAPSPSPCSCPTPSGDPSFDTVRTGAEARALFERDFADALPLIPGWSDDFERNPAGLLATLYLDRWHLDGRAVLLGDAAHAMVPFHGQGMNCAFEDCVALADHLERARGPARPRSPPSRPNAQPNARAIQAHGAGELPGDARPGRRRRLPAAARRSSATLAERHPGRFVPRYSMVTFMRMPYAIAFERGQVQRELLVELTRGHSSLDSSTGMRSMPRARAPAAASRRRAACRGDMVATHSRLDRSRWRLASPCACRSGTTQRCQPASSSTTSKPSARIRAARASPSSPRSAPTPT